MIKNKISLNPEKMIVKDPIMLIGGGLFKEKDIEENIEFANFIIAVDGGANKLKNTLPKYIIGDLDSLKNKKKWLKKGVKLLKVEEQSTTDFEKSLYSFNSSLYICIGFTGKRMDHFLSVCSSLIKFSEKNIILISKRDVIFSLPERFEINLPTGARISLIPFVDKIKLNSSGLKWNLKNLKFNFSNNISISNQTVNEKVIINTSKRGVLIIISKKFLRNLIEAVKLNN